MILDVKFEESKTSFECDFGEVNNISDGGFERGLAEGERIGYEKGSSEGYTKGEADGILVGQKNEYDRFWDNFQQNGERTDYQYAFGRLGWNDEIFKPKYKFFAKSVYGFDRMFTDHNGGITKITPDLFDLDKSSGVHCGYTFYNAQIKSIEFDMRKNSSIAHMFRDCKAESIILHNWGSYLNYDRTFESCRDVKHLWIEGTIAGSKPFLLTACIALDKESIKQTISILADTTSGKTISFSITAVNNAFETAEGLADGSTSAEWLALVATKPNWTISLA